MITKRTNAGKGKCIQLTWKGFEYALKVINGNNTVFVVSKKSCGEVVQKRRQYFFLIGS